MIGSAEGTVYGNSLQLIANAVDRRSKTAGCSQFVRAAISIGSLPPLSEASSVTLEYSNYGIALLALVLIFILHRSRLKSRVAKYHQWLSAQQDGAAGSSAMNRHVKALTLLLAVQLLILVGILLYHHAPRRTRPQRC
jgi:hypothetical protein